MTLYIMAVNSQYISHVEVSAIAARLTGLSDIVFQSLQGSKFPARNPAPSEASSDPIFCESLPSRGHVRKHQDIKLLP